MGKIVVTKKKKKKKEKQEITELSPFSPFNVEQSVPICRGRVFGSRTQARRLNCDRRDWNSSLERSRVRCYRVFRWTTFLLCSMSTEQTYNGNNSEFAATKIKETHFSTGSIWISHRLYRQVAILSGKHSTSIYSIQCNLRRLISFPLAWSKGDERLFHKSKRSNTQSNDTHTRSF
jgi:hypothetical protein